MSHDLHQLSIKGSSTDKLISHSAARSDQSHTTELPTVPEGSTVGSSVTLEPSEPTAAVEDYAGEGHSIETASEVPVQEKTSVPPPGQIDATEEAEVSEAKQSAT